MSTFSDLAHVVTWELVVPGAGVQWHAPLTRFHENAGTPPFRLPPGEAGRVGLEELADVLLAPIVETVTAGVMWENYELVQEYEARAARRTGCLRGPRPSPTRPWPVSSGSWPTSRRRGTCPG